MPIFKINWALKDKDIAYKRSGYEREFEMTLDKLTDGVKFLTNKIHTLSQNTKDNTTRLQQMKANLPDENSDKDIGYYDVLIDQLQRKLDAIQEGIMKYKIIKNNNEKIKEQNAQIRSQQWQDAQRIDELENVLRLQAVKNIENLQVCKEIFKNTFPVWLLSKLTALLEREMNTQLDLLYPRGKYNAKFILDAKSIHIVYSDHEADVSRLSGFERSVLTLAYKLALVKLKNYSFICFDEADAASSVDNYVEFYRSLNRIIYLSNNQYIIISHKPDVKNFFIERDCHEINL